MIAVLVSKNVRIVSTRSHCKRTDASEDRAIWCADALDSAGYKAWFDRSDLDMITTEALQVRGVGM